MAATRRGNNGAGAYAREALTEWGKAARYAARAVAARRAERATDKPPLTERLNPAKTDKGGRLGDVADIALSKFGAAGKLASKASLGSRITERMRGSEGSNADNEDGEPTARDGDDAGAVDSAQNGSAHNGAGGDAPVPIQESIDVALPIEAAYELATDFGEYPQFLHRVSGVEELDDTHVTFTAKLRGRDRKIEIEIVDERPNLRLDWECSGEIEHSGVISFHRLAPSLTRIELTVELEPSGLVERLVRSLHVTEHAIEDEMHRFKAYAELREADDIEPEEGPEDENELEAEEGLDDDEEFEDEEFEDENELEAEEELDDEEDFEDEDEPEPEEVEDEELERAGSGR
jgi:uncharacterized membrane protein